MGGSLTADGFKQYAAFCNAIHYRYPGKRIGYFNNYDRSLVIWIATGRGTLAHELIHLFLSDDFPNSPQWLNEGMASLQEECNHNVPLDNWRLIYIQAYKQNSERFLTIDNILAPCDNCDDLNTILHDCFSRYFCFYLNKQGKLKQLYKTFRSNKDSLSLCRQRELISQVCEQDIDKIQSDFYVWLNDRRLPQKWSSDIFVKYIQKYVRQGKLNIAYK